MEEAELLVFSLSLSSEIPPGEGLGLVSERGAVTGGAYRTAYHEISSNKVQSFSGAWRNGATRACVWVVLRALFLMDR